MLGRTLISLSLLAFAGTLQAATVKRIKPEKRIVILNEGADTGFMKKKKVCFFDEAGKKVACGRIRATKGKIASVLVKKEEDLAKIKEGMTAKIDMADKDVQINVSDTPATPVEESYSAHHYVGVFGAFPIVAPTSYQNIVYETPLGQQVNTMWTQESPVRSTSVGGEFGFGIGSFTLAIGGRSRSFSPKSITADYDDRNNDQTFEQYVIESGSGAAVGVYADLYFFRMDWGVASLNLGSGLDMDNSKVRMRAKVMTDGNDAPSLLYKVDSAVSAISLRAVAMLDFKFGMFGFRAGPVFYIPLSESQKLTVESYDAFASEYMRTKTVRDDIKEQMAHKSQFGAELLLMGYIAY